ncbi:MAG TPA: aldo/keto reductase [Phenylobacterium sp.]|uniref:aldo/keto reductase n=1 Tax=Phenylobacterium sp. TaxID=1871053 RepID=UPI002B48A3B6|nr:aldo/keto reductase [Phenylobacterium sp.]HKR90487.1 aldo/keto reductase [Phenylobacterium sp.]
MLQTAAVSRPAITLSDGQSMPQVGLGVWQTPADATASVVKAAIEAGYRSIDTAAAYENEAGVGEGARASGVAREEIFITTKLRSRDHGYDAALRAFDKSLKRLGVDYVDLFLIHWPAPRQDRYIDAWRALVRLQEEGRARSIGVSNFMVEHLRRIIGETGVIPVVNQIELHPKFQQTDLRAFHAGQGIVTEAWSPLGQGALLKHPVIARIAARHGRTPAQAIIRWHVEQRLVVIPKSANPERIAENFEVFDFRLDDEDMSAIAALDDPMGRMGPDPISFG